MRHENNLMSRSMTDCDLAFLPARVMRIRKGQGQWVEKNRCCILAGYAVLVQVGFSPPQEPRSLTLAFMPTRIDPVAVGLRRNRGRRQVAATA